MLRDLTIQNYRTFKDFHIDGLARVNLIVGMNNSGKTSLLEAIYLLVNQGIPHCLAEILYNRGEIVEHFGAPGEPQKYQLDYQIRHLFYDHLYYNKHIINIESNKEYNSPLQVTIDLQVNSLTTNHNSPIFNLVLSSGNRQNTILVNYDLTIGDQFFQPYRFPQVFLNSSPLISNFITPNSLKFEQLTALWNRITLTPREDQVMDAMRILEPKLERINFINQPTNNSGVLVRLRGQYPIPLGIMGDGMRRILTLAMAAVTVENGFLLVDEIDTGLHYQAQTDMWRFVMEVAKQLNVQVFAATHSWDCIVAFQEALEQVEDSSIGKLFRLSRKDDNIKAVEYTPDELSIAVRQSIEVR